MTTNRYAINFVNDFSFHDSISLSPGNGWDRNIERLHPRGKIGKMFCQSLPFESDVDKTINDVGRAEKTACRFNDTSFEFNRLMTRVVMSERPLINSDSEYQCDLGINLVLSDDKSLTEGWHRSTVSNIQAVVAIPTFNERVSVLGFIRDIILELSIANSPPVQAALHVWSDIDQSQRAHFPFDNFFEKKVEYLKTGLGSGSFITSHIYHDAKYVAFSSFIRDSYSANVSVNDAIDRWDGFIMSLISDKKPNSQKIAESLRDWPDLGGQLDISTITNKIEKDAKKGVNYLIVTTSEKIRDKLSIARYEIIQPEDLLSKSFQQLKTNDKNNHKNMHAIKFYCP
jgi:hypothetical protein